MVLDTEVDDGMKIEEGNVQMKQNLFEFWNEVWLRDVVLDDLLNDLRWQRRELISENEGLKFFEQETRFFALLEEWMNQLEQNIESTKDETVVNANSGYNVKVGGVFRNGDCQI